MTFSVNRTAEKAPVFVSQVPDAPLEAQTHLPKMAKDALQTQPAQTNTAAPLTDAELKGLPLTTVNEDGKPGDPFNFVFLGNKQQIEHAFVQAGWVPAQKLGLWSSLKMIFCTLFHTPYPDAPVSSLYLYNDKHRQRLAFERAGKTTKQRDHIRLWDTGRKDGKGREIWVAAATRDQGIEMNRRDWPMPTHRIAPNVDAERHVVEQSLTAAGADRVAVWHRGAHQGRNGEGDHYYTNGNVDVLTLNGEH